MAGLITTGSFGKAVYPHPFTSWVGLDYDYYPDMVAELFNVKTTDQSLEEVTIATTLGLFLPTAEGANTSYMGNNQTQTKRYTFPNYRLGFIVTRNMIEDGKGLDIVEKNARQIGKGYRETRNIVGCNIYNNAFTSELSADGATAIGSHTTSAGTVSNELSTQAAFSEAALEQASIEISNTRDDTGKRVPTYIKKLVVPRALAFTTSRVINNDMRPGTADRDINATYRAGIVPDCVIVDYLTSSTAYYFITNHQDKDGLVFYDRKGLEVSQDAVFDSDNLKYKGYARFGGGISDFRAIFASPG
jgi:hypothetical protein